MTPSPGPAQALAEEVGRSSQRPGAARTLLLDLDGTLAPIVSRPEQARVPGEILAAIRSLLGQGWTVAIVSGRPAAQVRRLVPVRGIRIFGSHGLEGSGRQPIADALGRLRDLGRKAGTVSHGIPGAMVERKIAGLAFHDRNVSEGDRPLFRRRLREFLRSADLEGLEALRGRRVLELRPRGIHKGMILGFLHPAARRARRDGSLVALGDDRTDEDLFKALRGKGLAVRVGRPRKTSAATRRLASPAAVRRFLVALACREAPRRRRRASTLRR